MEYSMAVEKHDYKRIDFLNSLTDINTFNADVMKHIKNVHSDHAIKRWECLCDVRKMELEKSDTYYEWLAYFVNQD